MAFIDWLRKQHEESARNQALFEGRPRVAASQAWGGYQDRPGGQRLMVRQPSSPTSVTLTEKDDGSSTKVTKWEPEKQLKATALPPEPVMSPGRELRGYPTFDRDSFRTRGMGGFTGGAQRYDMGADPGWLGVPQARAVPDPRRVQAQLLQRGFGTRGMGGFTGGAQRYDMGMDPGWAGVPRARPQTSIANIGVPPHVPRMRGDIGAADSIGMPQVANLRNRVREIDRQQAAIPRQQMPPPRFVPPVDWRNFPQVQDRNTGTYNTGDPRVQMGGGFDWTGRALRENVGEDLRNVWNPIGDRVKKMLEDIRRRREGQTMAPFDRGWY